MADLRWGTATDPGRIRPDNEDNLLAEPNVFAVADGMGGHRAGEVASALAVDLLRARLSAPGADLEQVVAAIAEVNGDIYRAAIGNPDQQGMGTTVTALAVIAVAAEPDENGSEAGGRRDDDGASEQLALVNVGDSRTYLLRHGRLRRVTVDHSYVQELVATGHITDDEARTHPRRNIVTRALGIDPAVRVDAWTLPLVRGDRFLLCSDGLVDEVRDDEIVGVLQTVTDPQAAADELVALANRQGGRDNISVIVVDVLDGAEPPDADTELDLEPAWDDAGGSATWAIDEPEAEATDVRRPRRPRQRRRGGRRTSPIGDRRHAGRDHRRAGRRRRGDRHAEAAPAPPHRLPRRARCARRVGAGAGDRRCLGPARLLRRLRRRTTTSSSTAAATAASCGSIQRWKP